MGGGIGKGLRTRDYFYLIFISVMFASETYPYMSTSRDEKSHWNQEKQIEFFGQIDFFSRKISFWPKK